MSTTSTLIQFRLNGEPVSRQVEPHHTLLELVRECGLHGARESCGQGLCGCCTIVVNGQAVTGCIYPAMHAEGAEVGVVDRVDKVAGGRGRRGFGGHDGNSKSGAKVQIGARACAKVQK